VILADTNIVMYAAGAPHPHKKPSAALLERVVLGKIDMVLDTEILQEILHRYRAINEWATGARIYDWVRRIFPVVVPVTKEIVDRARTLMDTYLRLTARDALHAAVCLHLGVDAICSYDRDFDVVAGLRRVKPEQLR
jgi:predicted nucleic acid-binding protein